MASRVPSATPTQGDELVAHGGQGALGGLGQDDVHHGAQAGKAQRTAGLGLALFHGHNAAADDLRHIGSAVETAGDDAHDHLVNTHGAEDAEVDNQHLKQKRRTTEQVDVEGGKLAQQSDQRNAQIGKEALATGGHILHLRQTQDGQQGAQRHTHQDGVEGNLQRNAQALQVLEPAVAGDQVHVDFFVQVLPEVERVGFNAGLDGLPPLLKDRDGFSQGNFLQTGGRWVSGGRSAGQRARLRGSAP